jgi:hypothetical protein
MFYKKVHVSLYMSVYFVAADQIFFTVSFILLVKQAKWGTSRPLPRPL